MTKIRLTLLIILGLSPLLAAMPACPSDFHLGMDMGASYSSHANYLDRGTLGLTDQLHFSGDRSYLLLQAEPYFAFTLQNNT